MTRETRFTAGKELIVVLGTIEGPRGIASIRLVVDTGASPTIIAPEILDDIGYSARDGQVTTTVSSAIGRERGYTLRVERFATRWRRSWRDACGRLPWIAVLEPALPSGAGCERAGTADSVHAK